MQFYPPYAGRPFFKDSDVTLLAKAGLLETIHTTIFYGSSVSAGFPSPADDYLEATLNLHEYVVKHPAATYFVRAQGDSMLDAGIFPGDLLIVDRSVEATHDKIVIAAINGQLTVKRLSKLNGCIQLLAANPAYSPITITEDEDFIIWGVVTFVIHNTG